MTSTEDGKIWTGAIWQPITDQDESRVRVEEVGKYPTTEENELVTFSTFPLGSGDPLWGLPREEFEERFQFTGETR